MPPTMPPPTVPTVPPVTPPPTSLPSDPARGRPVPQQPDRSAEYQQRLNQLLAKQQREDADAAKRHAALLQHPPIGMSAAQLQPVIDGENKAQAQRHQQERDALAKQYARPAG